MCFSATASFAAAGITGFAGVVATASGRHTPHRWLAVIPIYFAIQQMTEGIQWGVLEGGKHAAWQGPAALLFLFVANVVWPIWVPWAIKAGEPVVWRRRLLSGLLVIGILESAAEFWALAGHEVTTRLVGGHIGYHIGTVGPGWMIPAVVYPIVVVGPPLLSSNWLLRLVGAMVLVSLIVVRVAYRETTASVWCFFAAIISGLIVVIVRAGAVETARGVRDRP